MKRFKKAFLTLSACCIVAFPAWASLESGESADAGTTAHVVESRVLSSINGWPVAAHGSVTYGRTAGMCIDRTNRVAFVMKNTQEKDTDPENGSESKIVDNVCLYSTNSTTLTKGPASEVVWTKIAEWHAPKKGEWTVLGHPNDISCVPSGENTDIYVATDRAEKGIVKLTVNNSTHSLVGSPKTYYMYYKHDGADALRGCGSIGYSVGGGKFVARRTGVDDDNARVTCVVGGFSGSTFQWDKKFYLRLGTNISLPENGEKLDLTDWSPQGMCFYQSKIFLTMSNLNKPNQTVIIGYKTGGLGSVEAGKTFTPSAYYFDKITVDPSDNGKLENESADGYNDNIVFATNETGSRSDSVRMYTADQVSF